MKTLVFQDPWLAHQGACDEIQKFLGALQRRGDVGQVAWIIRENGAVGLLVEATLNSRQDITDIINAFLVRARLDHVQNFLLEALAWKFSSPALTQAFRGAILSLSPGTTHSPRMKT